MQNILQFPMKRPIDGTPIKVYVDEQTQSIKKVTMTKGSKKKAPWQPAESIEIQKSIAAFFKSAKPRQVNEQQTPSGAGPFGVGINALIEQLCQQPVESSPRAKAKVIEISPNQLSEFLQNPQAFIESLVEQEQNQQTEERPYTADELSAINQDMQASGNQIFLESSLTDEEIGRLVREAMIRNEGFKVLDAAGGRFSQQENECAGCDNLFCTTRKVALS